jgi:hypothetical protein
MGIVSPTRLEAPPCWLWVSGLLIGVGGVGDTRRSIKDATVVSTGGHYPTLDA